MAFLKNKFIYFERTILVIKKSEVIPIEPILELMILEKIPNMFLGFVEDVNINIFNKNEILDNILKKTTVLETIFNKFCINEI